MCDLTCHDVSTINIVFIIIIFLNFYTLGIIIIIKGFISNLVL